MVRDLGDATQKDPDGGSWHNGKPSKKPDGQPQTIVKAKERPRRSRVMSPAKTQPVIQLEVGNNFNDKHEEDDDDGV